MRLLTRNANPAGSGSLGFADYPTGSAVPPYAILSHTWGAEEVTYQDLLAQGNGNGTGVVQKSGYRKIRLCGEQAERDGLRHFWVDTCCIDKSNSTELARSINSMFAWYAGARVCYVYLADVSCPDGDGDGRDDRAWKSQFERSRWFRRGWTLQELIAPKTVRFFSEEGTYLGSRESLLNLIRDVTGIPARALRGDPLPDFTVPERMVWAERRETTEPEDKVYSMLGIFDVQMPLVYGEGEEKALNRLREEIAKDQKGKHHEEFSLPFSLHGVPEIEHFVAREQELTEMRDALRSDGSRRAVVLHGLGGMGKTQLAIAYAKRHRDRYSAVFWLNIKDESSLKQSFTRIAKQIRRRHPSVSGLGSAMLDNNLDEIIDAVKAWLSLPNNTRWLLIYDNYDNPRIPGHANPDAIDIKEYLPDAYQGSVIITTRSSQVKIGHGIRMQKMQNLEDSLEILSTTSKREASMEDPDAVNVAKQLDGLPLALATAGVYLEQTSTTFKSYLQIYTDSWGRLQLTSPELDSYEDRTLYSTWQLSFDQIRRQNENSAALLRLWAYFDNQDLWLELLQHNIKDRPQWIVEVTRDEIAFNQTVRVLINYGLVEVDLSQTELVESRGYSVHGCVHSWITCVLNETPSEYWASFAIQCIAAHVPDQSKPKWWLTERRLLQQAARCHQSALDKTMDPDSSWIGSRLGWLYRDQGKLREAEEMNHKSLQSYEKARGPDHLLTLQAVGNLALLYYDQGRLHEAEAMYRRGLHGFEKTHGLDHLLTFRAVHHLAILYGDQGKLGEAEDMCQRALQGFEKALGPDDTVTLQAVHNLGIIYSDQGRLHEAEHMYQVSSLGSFIPPLGRFRASLLPHAPETRAGPPTPSLSDNY
ncbi:kinesin light chain [Nemania sp. NC0429]|nr:kinesin light chain [Nemania sp. NC0429]